MIIQKLKETFRKMPLGILAAGFLLIVFSEGAFAEVKDIYDTKTEKNVMIYKGDLVTLKVYSLTRIAITTPGFIEIVKADVDELLLIGKKVGETPMYIWDEHGKRNIMIRVFKQDLDMVIDRIERLFVPAGIEGVEMKTSEYEGKIVITGVVAKDKKAAYDKIVGRFKKNIIDMTSTEGELIQIDIQVSELSTTLSSVFGFNWTTGDEGLVFSYPETLPSFDGSFSDWFKIGDFNRTTQILLTVSALIQEGKGRVLSKPTVVVNDGQSTSFMVGGEIPIVTTTASSGGNVSENVSFKNYGVQISTTPRIKANKIEVQFNVSVREIDSSNPVAGQVAFTTTSTGTKISLDDGQTVVLAGLIKHNTSDTLKRVPWLSKIPLIGILFRSRAVPLTDKEIVISLTPRIVTEELAVKTKEITKEEADLLTEEDLFGESEETEEDEMAEEVFSEDFSDKEPQDAFEESKDLAEENMFEEEQMGSLEDRLDEVLTDEDPFVFDEPEPPPPPPEDIADDEKADAVFNPWGGAPEEVDKEEKEFFEEDSLLVNEKEEIEEVNSSDVIAGYVQSLQKKISNAISFPYEAKKQGWAGMVKLSLLILSDGSLSEANIRESSGHGIFDKDAMNTAQLLAPFDPFPAELDLEEIWVTIPIVYNQEIVLEEAE